MDPTIAAALIGVTGAALVAVVSSVTTARTIRQSLADGHLSARAGLDAGHEERIWDKKAELYVELLLDEARRRTTREGRLKEYKAAEYGERPRGPVVAHDVQAWANFDARVRAFGSDLVLLAFQEAMLASQAVHDRDQEWQAGSPAAPAAGARPQHSAKDEVIAAMEQADRADRQFADPIRADLQSPLSATSALIQSRSSGTRAVHAVPR
jgi:hypothetical protein